jgi:predicted DNA-binding transcriptional regulator AlpA
VTNKFQHLGSSVGSKVIPRGQGGVPAFERTEGEKIALARKYLESRNFVVLPYLVTRKEVCAYLRCSEGHLNNLLSETDFPEPFDVGAIKNNINSRTQPRWKMSEVSDWMNSKTIVKHGGQG